MGGHSSRSRSLGKGAVDVFIAQDLTIYPPKFVPYGIDEVVTIMMDLVAWDTGQWKEGVARLELPCVENLNSERIVMINNSSLDKWKRLSHKQLDQQFIHEIIHGLDCSPFEASAILDTVYRVYAPYFETTATLKPGHVFFQVISVETSANTPLEGWVIFLLSLRCGTKQWNDPSHGCSVYM
jgi:hypothetical protein